MGQRAKMSERAGRETSATLKAHGAELLRSMQAEWAEREARAILAETEPAGGASFYVVDARGLRAGECLADALRAFVEC